MQMPCGASVLFGPPPQVHGQPKCVMRSLLLLDQVAGTRLSADGAAVPISLPCLRKAVMCLRMSGPLERAGHHRVHATRRLAGQHVSLSTIGSKGWPARGRADFSVGIPDGILVISL